MFREERSSQCKGPEVGTSLAGSRATRVASCWASCGFQPKCVRSRGGTSPDSARVAVGGLSGARVPVERGDRAQGGFTVVSTPAATPVLQTLAIS